MSSPAGFAGRQSIYNVAFRDDQELFRAYMPFVKNGGLFTTTHNRVPLGQPVFMVVTLPDSSEKLPVSGKVVWLTPVGAQGNRPAGIGVQFDDTPEAHQARNRIESLLAGKLQSEKATYTM